MSMTKEDRETLISLLDGLSSRTLNEIGATGRTITVFMKQRNIKWEDILVQDVETVGLLVNDENEEQLLNECAKHIDRLTDFEQKFIPDNIEKFKEYGYMTLGQRKILDRIVRKLQRLGIWEGEVREMAKRSSPSPAPRGPTNENIRRRGSESNC